MVWRIHPFSPPSAIGPFSVFHLAFQFVFAFGRLAAAAPSQSSIVFWNCMFSDWHTVEISFGSHFQSFCHWILPCLQLIAPEPSFITINAPHCDTFQVSLRWVENQFHQKRWAPKLWVSPRPIFSSARPCQCFTAESVSQLTWFHCRGLHLEFKHPFLICVGIFRPC